MSHYFAAADAAQLAREYPLGGDFTRRFAQISRDELRAVQERRFAALLRRAWQVPFYARRWGAAGLQPGDIRGLEDIARLPVYSKADLMESIAAHPPLGDFHGLDSYAPGARPQTILHTTSGTTGRPQVLLFGPRSREIQNLLLARLYLLQGLRGDDVVHSVYGHGMVNGGHYMREAVLHWTRALFLSAGTGIETRSATQVELMRDFRATVLIGFPDYLRKLAGVARSAGMEPGADIPVRLILTHLGREDRAALSQEWGGAAVFDLYGVGDTGIVAGEGPEQNGLFVMEDAHYVEVLDSESGAPAAEGAPGDLVITSLFKDDVYPIVRFNTHDVSAWRGGAAGLALRRIAGFLGRSDNMVKLRGINVFPQAIGPLLEELPGYAGDYLCRCARDGSGRDSMTVLAEFADRSDAQAGALRELLRRRLGVEVEVELAPKGALAPQTGIETRQKPIRLLDLRGAQP